MTLVTINDLIITEFKKVAEKAKQANYYEQCYSSLLEFFRDAML